MTYDFAAIFRPPSAVGAGIAGQVDEFQHSAVGIKEIGAWPVDDAALAVFLESDLDVVSAQMVERGRIILDGERMMHAAMVLRRRVDRRIALDEDEAGPGSVEKGHGPLPHRGEMPAA